MCNNNAYFSKSGQSLRTRPVTDPEITKYRVCMGVQTGSEVENVRFARVPFMRVATVFVHSQCLSDEWRNGLPDFLIKIKTTEKKIDTKTKPHSFPLGQFLGDVTSNRRTRLTKTRSCNTSSATLKGHSKSRIQPNSKLFFPTCFE